MIVIIRLKLPFTGDVSTTIINLSLITDKTAAMQVHK